MKILFHVVLFFYLFSIPCNTFAKGEKFTAIIINEKENSDRITFLMPFALLNTEKNRETQISALQFLIIICKKINFDKNGDSVKILLHDCFINNYLFFGEMNLVYKHNNKPVETKDMEFSFNSPEKEFIFINQRRLSLVECVEKIKSL